MSARVGFACPKAAALVAALALGGGLVGCADSPPPAAVAAPAAAPVAAPAPAPAPAAEPAAPPRATPDAPFRESPPVAAAEAAFAVPPFRRFKLKNGLEVILAEFHDLPLVELNLVFKAGSAANPPDLAGLADLTRRMLEEGTKTRSAPQIADDLATLGATLGGGGGWDSSSLSLSVLTKNLDAGLALFADVVSAPAFDAKEFERVRDNTLTAIARRKDSPPTVASLAFSRLLFGVKHPYGWPVTGVEASLGKMTPADLRAFYEKRFRPNQAVLIVAGDTSENALRTKLEASFKGWKPRPAAATKLPAATPAADKTRIFLIDKAGAPQSSIRVGTVAIDRKSPDYFPAIVMNMIFGGGFYRLDMNLREGKAWTYGARSSLDPRRTPGPLSAGGEFVAPHTAESVEEILKEVAGMRDADVTDAELSRAKDQIAKSFPARFATRAQVSAQLAEVAVYGLKDDYLATYTKKVAAVTKDDVRRVARKLLDPARLTIVVVGDQKSLKDPLSRIATVELRDLEGNPIPTAKD